MKHTLIISSVCQQDVADALRHYLSVSHPAAKKLLEAIDQAYEKLESNPEFYSFYGESKILRRYILKPFPYCFVYQVRGERVFVAGFHHTHQNPEDILKRAQ